MRTYKPGSASKLTQQLAHELGRLPTQPNAAMRLLWALDDPKTSAGELARLVEADPALSTKIMRLANSPAYGMFRGVRSAAHAIMVLGFVTVRTLAITTACGLFVDRRRSLPKGFWQHSAATASAASVVAPRLGVSVSDAFSAGLLHDLGAALLFRYDPETYDAVVDETISSERSLLEVEEETYGATHAWLAAAVLEIWNFPADFVGAVAGHHNPNHDHALTRAVVLGKILAARLGRSMEHDETPAVSEVWKILNVAEDDVEPILESITLEVEELGNLFSW